MFSFLSPIKSITTTALANLLVANPKINLLDVRTPTEYKAGHINKAVNKPLDSLANFNGPADKEYYVICQSGMRSKRASKILTKKGYNVINITGGMHAWQGRVIGGK